MKTANLELPNLGTVMSNFDHAIDQEVAQELLAGDCRAEYTGWNFFGNVWYEPGPKKYCCEVMQYHATMETVECDTLEDIMRTVSEKYGWD